MKRILMFVISTMSFGLFTALAYEYDDGQMRFYVPEKICWIQGGVVYIPLLNNDLDMNNYEYEVESNRGEWDDKLYSYLNIGIDGAPGVARIEQFYPDRLLTEDPVTKRSPYNPNADMSHCGSLVILARTKQLTPGYHEIHIPAGTVKLLNYKNIADPLHLWTNQEMNIKICCAKIKGYIDCNQPEMDYITDFHDVNIVLQELQGEEPEKIESVEIVENLNTIEHPRVVCANTGFLQTGLHTSRYYVHQLDYEEARIDIPSFSQDEEARIGFDCDIILKDAPFQGCYEYFIMIPSYQVAINDYYLVEFKSIGFEYDSVISGIGETMNEQKATQYISNLSEIKAYGLSGVLVYSGKFSDMNLPKGIYIVKEGNECRKIAIP